MKFLLSIKLILVIEPIILLLASINMDTGTIISTTITTIGVIVVALINYRLGSKVAGYHKEVNGKMGQLLEVTAQAGKAEGKLEGRKEHKEETEGKK